MTLPRSNIWKSTRCKSLEEQNIAIITFLIMVYDPYNQYSFTTSDFIISPTNGLVIENDAEFS